MCIKLLTWCLLHDIELDSQLLIFRVLFPVTSSMWFLNADSKRLVYTHRDISQIRQLLSTSCCQLPPAIYIQITEERGHWLLSLEAKWESLFHQWSYLPHSGISRRMLKGRPSEYSKNHCAKALLPFPGEVLFFIIKVKSPIQGLTIQPIPHGLLSKIWQDAVRGVAISFLKVYGSMLKNDCKR